MAFKFGAMAFLTLSALLSVQAQVPNSGGQKTQDNTATASALHFSIYGLVAKPGVYLLKPGDRVENALGDALGPTERADLGVIMLTHAAKSHNMANMVWVNFNDFVLKGKMTGNPLVQPGDGLYILSKGSRYRPLSPVIVN